MLFVERLYEKNMSKIKNVQSKKALFWWFLTVYAFILAYFRQIWKSVFPYGIIFEVEFCSNSTKCTIARISNIKSNIYVEYVKRHWYNMNVTKI